MKGLRWWVVAAIGCGVSAQVEVFRDEAVDDAFISLRYARNLWLHHELSYNVGEPPVEGFSNLLWTLLCAPGAALSAPALLWPRLLSMLLFAASAWLLGMLGRRIAPMSQEAGAWTFALTLAAPGFTYWHFAGLEAPLVSTLVLACLCCADDDAGKPSRFLPVAAALLALTRIDGVVTVAACLLGILTLGWTPTRVRRVLVSGLVVLVVLAAYQWFRVAYFGDALPNTLRAKSGAFFRDVTSGLLYVALPLAHAPMLALAGLSPRWLRALDEPAARLARVVAVVTIVQLAYVIAVGGDWMPLYRFVAPFTPLLALLTVFVLGRLAQAWGERRGRLLRVLVGAVAFSPLLGLLIFFLGRGPLDVRMASEVTELSRLLGSDLARTLPAQAKTADGTAGAGPFYSQRNNIDMLGLTDRVIARARVSRYASTILPVGHRMGDGDYVLSQRPDALIFVAGRASSPGNYVSEAELAFDPRFHAYYRLEQRKLARPAVSAGWVFTGMEQAAGLLDFAALEAKPRALGVELVRRPQVTFHLYRRMQAPEGPARTTMAEVAARLEHGDPVAAAKLLEAQQPLLAKEGLGALVPAMLARIWLVAGQERKARAYLDMAQRMLSPDWLSLFHAWIRVDPVFEGLLNNLLPPP